ncbi:hypothetical protein RND81_05G203000 [Saponaria officinalis]|uniref:C2 domain-containing protein n=3 Tax=Saponaria officinalis TaxID=3572 RepID=A0AAW1L047_SAPOF
MGHKTLELTVISAKDLKNVNLIGKMDVYVVVYLSDQPKSKQKTPVHQDGGTKPSWNYTMRFTVDEPSNPGKFVVFQLKHEQTFGADKDLGEVNVPLMELFTSVNAKDPSAPQFLTYQVKTSSGKAKGELKFSFKFVDLGHNIAYDAGSSKPAQSCGSSSGYPPSGPSGVAGGSHAYPPPGGYPPPGQQAASMYPPPQQAGYPPPQHAHAEVYPPPPAGYPHPQQGHAQGYPAGVPYAAPQGYPPQGGYPPQQGGYGYPPQQGGYGYPPQGGYPPNPGAGYGYGQKPQKPKKNKNGGFGMGMGAGLLGGVVGGLVLGEVMDDAFDGGFDDGGFDF